MRGLMVLLAFVLIGAGEIVAFSTRTVNGWMLLAVVGVLILGNELRLESKAQQHANRTKVS